MEDNIIVKEYEVFGQKIQTKYDTEKEVDFNNEAVIPNIFGTDVHITETIFNTWIIIAVTLIFSLTVKLLSRKFTEVPTGFQNIIEGLIEMFDNFVKSTMGAHNMKFAPFYMGIFIFVLMCNLSGLFALRPPTADYATTLALGLITFFMIQGFAIAKKGFINRVKEWFEPLPLLFPINIIGDIATPISLSFRLFGNILGGTIIMGLFYSLPWLIVKLGLPAVLHSYFDVFAGALQAFIFTVLSMTFVAGAIPDPEDEN